MDLSIYFEPVGDLGYKFDKESAQFGSWITVNQENNFPDFKEAKIAILGVMEDTGAVGNKGCAEGADEVRKYLYRLFRLDFTAPVVDLGNIKSGHEVEDTYFAVSSVVTELIKNDTIPVIIGGGNDLAYAVYRAYEKLEQTVNIVSIDSMFDIGTMEQPVDSRTYLSKIILYQPNYLFNYSNIGYQSYFVDRDSIDLLDKLYFDTYRLGQVRSNMTEVEPIVRNADMLSFDISAVRQTDAPGNSNASPNGFYGDEACQLTRYAGISDKLTSIGFYEFNPAKDISGQTAHLVAQMIWYFIEGVNNRKSDYPVGDKDEYTKYRVALEEDKYEIVFYKSNKSDRWWMDVPYPSSQKSKFERHHMVPCSYEDYQLACKEDMPDRWWQAYQKLS